MSTFETKIDSENKMNTASSSKNEELENFGQNFINQIQGRMKAESSNIRSLEHELKIAPTNFIKKALHKLIAEGHARMSAYVMVQKDFIDQIEDHQDINIKLYEVEEG